VAHRSLTFAPESDPTKYRTCTDTIVHLPVDPAGGLALTLGDDDFAEFDLTDGKTVQLFGQQYGRVFVGSNGYLTFAAGDTTNYANAANHFSTPRVSGLFADLVPSSRGSVRVQQLADRFAATYIDIPVYVSGGVYTAENSHTFQIELFFDGTIRITSTGWPRW